jgi:tetratricopeptide (TPR) repeat protein
MILLLRRAWLIALCLAFFNSPGSGATLNQSEINDLFSQGKEFFRQANQTRDPREAQDLYGKAVLRFERIIREGDLQNGKLYYNIGNAYFRMDDIGRAILNYRRAQQFIPNDLNLNQNLDYARQRRMDKIDVPQKTRVLKTLFFWHYDLSTGFRSFLFALSFILVWIALGTRLFIRKQYLHWIIGISALVSALFLISLLVEMTSLHSTRPGVILAKEVVARKGDSQTYEPSFTEPLHAGTEFTLIEDRGDWLYIQLTDGRRCWLPSKSVGLVREG